MLASFQGLIGYVEVPDLFTFVNLGRRTGVTELTRPDQSTRVFFQKGNPVFATSDREGLRLGDLLLRMGKISRKDLDRVSARYRPGGPQIGQLFVADGLITFEELTSHLKVQISEVIFDLFNWNEGTFSFYDDVAPPPDAVTLQMDIQNLLMEGVRRLDERGRLAEVFPDLDAVMEVYGNRETLRDSLTLTPDEWRLLFLIDGRRTLREVCQLAGNPDDLGSLEVMKRLLTGNLIGFSRSHLSSSSVPVMPPALAVQEPSVDGGSARDDGPDAPRSSASAADLSALVAEVLFDARVEARPSADPRERSDAGVVVSPTAVQYSAQTMALWARLVLKAAGQTRSFPLAMETQTLGRSPNNNIVIADPVVSTFHARIDRTRDGFNIVDLSSTNGTFLNGKRVATALLKPHDEIQVGSVRLTYLEE
jgi:hypothetical protein